MATQSNNQPTIKWEEIVERVLQNFDRNDPADRSAVDQWESYVEKVRQRAAVHDIVTSFSSPEVLEGALAFFIADIEDNRANYYQRLAQVRRQQQLMNLQLLLGAKQGCFPSQQGGEEVVPEMLAVMKVNPKAQQRLLAEVVALSKKLAQGDVVEEELDRQTALGGFQEYTADLTEFLSRNGDAGRQLVQRVCQDRNYAQEAAQEEQQPKCIRFLADIVTKVNNSLPPQAPPERRMGFKPAGRAVV
jgi:hypothetical protein